MKSQEKGNGRNREVFRLSPVMWEIEDESLFIEVTGVYSPTPFSCSSKKDLFHRTFYVTLKLPVGLELRGYAAVSLVETLFSLDSFVSKDTCVTLAMESGRSMKDINDKLREVILRVLIPLVAHSEGGTECPKL